MTLALVDDLLDYGRVVDQDMTWEAVALDDLVAETVEDLHSDIQAAGAKLHISPLPVVQGNPAQLRMLVHNLMSNAVKYRRPDVELEIHVDGSILEDGNRTLSIRDNGCGIPETHIDRVFGVFTRLHRHEEIPGTGLGLALCKRIASNHNGSISVSSTKGQGSTFNVRLAG